MANSHSRHNITGVDPSNTPQRAKESPRDPQRPPKHAEKRRNDTKSGISGKSPRKATHPRRSALHRAALKYAAKKIPVFPCEPGGKRPLTKRGYLDATTDPRKINLWWNRWPKANIGIPTGEASGLFVLDVDRGDDERWSGFAPLDALLKEHGDLPETTTVQTGRGGMQYWFEYPDGAEIRNSAGKLGLGLDVRGEGGYVVAPPSRTQGRYRWLEPEERRGLAEAPAWIVEAAREPHRGSERVSGGRPTVSAEPDGEPIPEGTRNDTLTRIAGRLHDGTRSLEELVAELLTINAARCDPPLAEQEVIGIARSIHSRPPCKRAPEPSAELMEAARGLRACELLGRHWKGTSGQTDRAMYQAALIEAEKHGRLRKSGIAISLAMRPWARAAGVSNRTGSGSFKRLKAAGLVCRVSRGKGTESGTILLRFTQTFDTLSTRGGLSSSVEDLSSVVSKLLRLRWGPGRAGKTAAEYLEHLARRGPLSLSELSDLAGRRPYNVRRTLDRLQARALVECFADRYQIPEDFLEALDNELEATGIKRAERLEAAEYERQRLAYAEYLDSRRRERRRRKQEPDGCTAELERVEEDPEPAPDAVITDAKDPEQVRALADLMRREIARRRENIPDAPHDRARRLAARLKRERRDVYERYRGDPRKLSWEISGLGWTNTVFGGNTMRRALEELERSGAAA